MSKSPAHVHVRVHAIVNGTEVFPEYCTQHYDNTGWTISLPTMSLVFGHRVPRRHVPLGNVLDFELVDADGTGCPHERAPEGHAAWVDAVEQAFFPGAKGPNPDGDATVRDHDSDQLPDGLEDALRNLDSVWGGAELDAVQERYPGLSHAVDRVLRFMPGWTEAHGA